MDGGTAAQKSKADVRTEKVNRKKCDIALLAAELVIASDTALLFLILGEALRLLFALLTPHAILTM